MKLDQARVLLTGASGGIGQAMQQALLQAGAQVLGISRQPHASTHSHLTWHQADLTEPQGINEVTRIGSEWQANVLVHAAGLPGFGALPSLSTATINQVIQANLLTPMLLTQAMLLHLQSLAQAQVVFVGSALGRIGLPGFSVYGASKAGLHGFAEALRRELAGSSVLIQTLAPRSTRTTFNSAAAERYNQATGTSVDTPETVAQALLRLIESQAAEQFIGWPERLAVRLNGALGPLLDSSFTKHRQALAQPATDITSKTTLRGPQP